MTRINNTRRIINIAHDLNAQDIKSLNSKERHILDRLLNDKPIYSIFERGTRDPSSDINNLRNKLITIRNNKDPQLAIKKLSVCTRILNFFGILTQSQRLNKTVEKAWKKTHPSTKDCGEALNKAKKPLQIYKAVQFADPETSSVLIFNAIQRLQSWEQANQDKPSVLEALKPLKENLKSKLNQKEFHSLVRQFTSLADEENYDKLASLVDLKKDVMQQQLAEADANDKASILLSFQKVLESALESLSEPNTNSAELQKTLRLHLAEMLYYHVEKQKDAKNVNDLAKRARNSMLPVSNNDIDYFEYFAKLEKLNDAT